MSKTKDHKNLKAIHNDYSLGIQVAWMSKTKDHKNLKAIHNQKEVMQYFDVMSKTKDHKNLKAIHNLSIDYGTPIPDVKDQRS